MLKLTIDDHGLLHEVFINEAADFASVGSAQLGGWSKDL